MAWRYTGSAWTWQCVAVSFTLQLEVQDKDTGIVEEIKGKGTGGVDHADHPTQQGRRRQAVTLRQRRHVRLKRRSAAQLLMAASAFPSRPSGQVFSGQAERRCREGRALSTVGGVAVLTSCRPRRAPCRRAMLHPARRRRRRLDVCAPQPPGRATPSCSPRQRSASS